MHKFTSICLLLFLSQLTFAQSFTIRGYVSDQSSGERLLNANIYEKQLLKGTITNSFGFYSLTLPKGNYSLTCSFVGYKTQHLDINLQKDTVADL